MPVCIGSSVRDVFRPKFRVISLARGSGGNCITQGKCQRGEAQAHGAKRLLPRNAPRSHTVTMEFYFLLLTVFGAVVILTAWLPRLLRRLPLSLPMVCIGIGFVLVWTPFSPVTWVNPLENRYLTERLTEFVVIIALDRPVQNPGRDEATQCERAHEGRRFPMTVRHAGPEPLAARASAVATRHVGRGPRLVDEDEAFGIEIGLAFERDQPRSRLRQALCHSRHMSTR